MAYINNPATENGTWVYNTQRTMQEQLEEIISHEFTNVRVCILRRVRGAVYYRAEATSEGRPTRLVGAVTLGTTEFQGGTDPHVVSYLCVRVELA